MLTVSTRIEIYVLLLISLDCCTMATSLRLSGQRVLVTGAGRGIGRAIAQLCAAEGARVALTARTTLELEETARLLPKGQSLVLTADVTSDEQVESLVQAVVQAWGGIDILVNNAGGAQASKGLLHELPAVNLTRLLDLNVVSVHRVTAAVLKHAMLAQQSGKIINISSRAGKQGLPQMSSYVASKFALEGLTATLAAELKDQGITVNSISPGMVDTRSFPKAPEKRGVRTPESIANGLWTVLESPSSGHYLHVDELDSAVAQGFSPSTALKPINELGFQAYLEPRKQENASGPSQKIP
jgi:3-oxoacyl-[acyl-carrier protein] reductase